MKKRLLLLKFFLACVFNVLLAEVSAYTLKTKTLTGFINPKTGLIYFWDTNSKKIVVEKSFAGCNYQAAKSDDNRYHRFTQISQSTADAAEFGPCQYPDAMINYYDQLVSFFQNNQKTTYKNLVKLNI